MAATVAGSPSRGVIRPCDPTRESRRRRDAPAPASGGLCPLGLRSMARRPLPSLRPRSRCGTLRGFQTSPLRFASAHAARDARNVPPAPFARLGLSPGRPLLLPRVASGPTPGSQAHSAAACLQDMDSSGQTVVPPVCLPESSCPRAGARGVARREIDSLPPKDKGQSACCGLAQTQHGYHPTERRDQLRFQRLRLTSLVRSLFIGQLEEPSQPRNDCLCATIEHRLAIALDNVHFHHDSDDVILIGHIA